MEVVGGAVASIVSCLCNNMDTPAQQQCQYLNNPTKEMEILGNGKNDLIAQANDVKMKLQRDEEQGKTRSNEADVWLKEVDEFKAKADDLERRATLATQWLNGVVPNCHSRLNFGRRVSKLIKEVNRLLEKADKLSDHSIAISVPEMGMEFPTPPLIGETTAQKNLERVWDCLMADEVRIIGVYGMGGVGKTIMMKNINNRILKQNNIRFDKVVWVTVSQDHASVYKQLQSDISNKLDLDLSGKEDDLERSSLLFKELCNRGRVLLILDDMWEAFSLHEIGIPDLTKDNGCTLVLTTRSLEVCERMGCQKNIQVELLRDDEAWELFSKEIDIELVPEIEKFAKDVAKECSRLPLAIVTVGGAMRGKDDIREWRLALADLQESRNGTVIEKVNKCLEFSYNRLNDEIIQKCFLYCALYPEDSQIDIDELIDLWVMDELIKERSIECELDRGYLIVKKLQQCSMLECGAGYGFSSDRGYVKMHDLIRDMALRITDGRFMVFKAGATTSTNLPNEEEWGNNIEKASFMESEITEISISPNCHGLTTVLLKDCVSMKHIARGFFEHMQGLRVLNLSKTPIELLPESVSDLVNLHVLDLSECWLLKIVPSLEKLVSLRVLNLHRTGIKELPRGMEALINLKRFYLTATQIYSIEILSILISKLRLLHVYPSLICPSHHRIHVLLSLTHLESVFVRFQDVTDLNKYVTSENFKHLKYFYLVVGVERNIINSYYNRLFRVRRLSICDIFSRERKNVLLLPQNIEELKVIECNDHLTRNLSEMVCFKDAKELKSCEIKKCYKIEHILLISEEEEENKSGPLLQHLEDLKIEDCPKLITLCQGVTTLETLSCLKKLEIRRCHNLRYVFSLKLFRRLKNLEEVYISHCDELEELISCLSEEERTRAAAASIRLRWLELRSLPKLKTLFSKSMLLYVQDLEEVRVTGCERMKELIASEEEEKEEVRSDGRNGDNNNSTIVLPKLKTLYLDGLEKLESICKGEMVCDSLSTVYIAKCEELKRLPILSGEEQSPPLGLVEIKGSNIWWDSLEWDNSPFAKSLLQHVFKPVDESPDFTPLMMQLNSPSRDDFPLDLNFPASSIEWDLLSCDDLFRDALFLENILLPLFPEYAIEDDNDGPSQSNPSTSTDVFPLDLNFPEYAIEDDNDCPSQNNPSTSTNGFPLDTPHLLHL